MSSWPSIEQAPPTLWGYYARLVSILRRESETSGRLHEFEVAAPSLVQLNEEGNACMFGFGGVVYSYSRDLGEDGVVFEHRDGLTTVYTSRGALALASRGRASYGTDPLLVALELPPPPFPERN